MKKSTATDALKVSVTHSLAQAMQQSPDWASATDVQSAVKVWGKDADSIDANAKAIANLRAQLKAAEAQQEGLRRDWQASKKQVLSTVTVYCGGSADKVKGFNLDVVTRARLGALATPTSLAVNPGKVQGEVVSSWAKGLATHGFLVQHATDPTNAATVSAARGLHQAEVHARRHAAEREREHPRRGHRSRVAHGAVPVERVGRGQRALTARGRRG